MSHFYPPFRCCALLTLTVIFVWQASLSVQKYLKGDTTIVVQTLKENKQRFPSISLCLHLNPIGTRSDVNDAEGQKGDFFLYYEHHRTKG